jgi:hypothetical protein
VRAGELEISNLKRDKERLMARINKISANPSGEVEHRRLNHSAELNAVDCTDELRKAFESTAQVLLTLLERIDGLEVDYETCQVLDKSARPGQQVISEPSKAQWFISWIKSRS